MKHFPPRRANFTCSALECSSVPNRCEKPKRTPPYVKKSVYVAQRRSLLPPYSRSRHGVVFDVFPIHHFLGFFSSV